MFYMISTAVKWNVEMNCLKRRRLWMPLPSGGNIFQRIAPTNWIYFRPDGPRRKGTCNSLVTLPRLVRCSILFVKIVKNVDNNLLERPSRHLNTKSKAFYRYSWAIRLTLRRCLRGAVAVWRLTRKTARMPDLAIFQHETARCCSDWVKNCWRHTSRVTRS